MPKWLIWTIVIVGLLILLFGFGGAGHAIGSGFHGVGSFFHGFKSGISGH